MPQLTPCRGYEMKGRSRRFAITRQCRVCRQMQEEFQRSGIGRGDKKGCGQAEECTVGHRVEARSNFHLHIEGGPQGKAAGPDRMNPLRKDGR